MEIMDLGLNFGTLAFILGVAIGLGCVLIYILKEIWYKRVETLVKDPILATGLSVGYACASVGVIAIYISVVVMIFLSFW